MEDRRSGWVDRNELEIKRRSVSAEGAQGDGGGEEGSDVGGGEEGGGEEEEGRREGEEGSEEGRLVWSAFLMPGVDLSACSGAWLRR